MLILYNFFVLCKLIIIEQWNKQIKHFKNESAELFARDIRELEPMAAGSHRAVHSGAGVCLPLCVCVSVCEVIYCGCGG